MHQTAECQNMWGKIDRNQREMDKSNILIGEFNTPLSKPEKSSKYEFKIRPVLS